MPIMLTDRPVLSGKSSGTVTGSDTDTLAVDVTGYLDSTETMTGTPVITEEGVLIGKGDVAAAGNTITLENNTLAVGDVVWSQTGNIGRLRQGHHYYVLTVDDDDITLSATSGGTELDIGSDGTAEIWKYGTSDLTLASKAVNVASMTIKGKTVAIGKAIQWSCTGQQAGYTYAVRVSCGTTGSRTKVFLVSFKCV